MWTWKPGAKVPMREIREFAARAAAGFRPDRIILFGPYARGEATADADVCLLVVIRHRGKSRLPAKIRQCANATFPLILLCRTPTQVRQALALGDSLMCEILEQGRLLYDGHHS